MTSYAHTQLVKAIALVDEFPAGKEDYARWIEGGQHLELLRKNALEDEIIVYGSGESTFIHSAVVANEALEPIDEDDLLSWSCNPFNNVANYVSRFDGGDTWIERDMHGAGSKTLEAAKQLVFCRTFEGWTGGIEPPIEVLQEYVHLSGIHWIPEHQAYCCFDEHGDIDPVVSITTRDQDAADVALVSFKRAPLEEYLAASDSSLLRMFDYTLFRRNGFSGWPEGPEDLGGKGEALVYRQKIVAGVAGYTRGFQLVRNTREKGEVLSDMRDRWSGRSTKKYVEFLAHDWRNNRLANISTDPSASTNYFQTEGNTLPFELSPAFFAPEVLSKYKTDSQKYAVGARSVSCRGAWHLRGYDVNEADQVHAYICDLRNLPYREQLHWASFNEEPKAGISRRAFLSDFKGEWATQIDPLQSIMSTLRGWHEKNVVWWNLRDENLIESISVPRSSSRDLWADAFMDLSKLVVEGFKEKEIRKKLLAAGVEGEENTRSIGLLEVLIVARGLKTEVTRLEGIRTAQRIRSKVKGHAGSSEAQVLSSDALRKHGSYSNHFEYICGLVIEELGLIESALVS